MRNHVVKGAYFRSGRRINGQQQGTDRPLLKLISSVVSLKWQLLRLTNSFEVVSFEVVSFEVVSFEVVSFEVVSFEVVSFPERFSQRILVERKNDIVLHTVPGLEYCRQTDSPSEEYNINHA
jgi:hypothetical protein